MFSRLDFCLVLGGADSLVPMGSGFVVVFKRDSLSVRGFNAAHGYCALCFLEEDALFNCCVLEGITGA